LQGRQETEPRTAADSIGEHDGHYTAGSLFGNTFDGGDIYLGTAFELSPGSGGTWTFNTIYTFGLVNGDPYYPLSDFVMDSAGNLYGTAYGPTGTFSNAGTVYKLSQSGGVWSATLLYAFAAAPDGNAPYGGELRLRREPVRHDVVWRDVHGLPLGMRNHLQTNRQWVRRIHRKCLVFVQRRRGWRGTRVERMGGRCGECFYYGVVRRRGTSGNSV
jgi:hypothetical protein